MAGSSTDDFARRLFGGTEPADKRSQHCLETIRRALEEHGCELQIWAPIGGNSPQAWEIKVVPVKEDRPRAA